VVALIACGATAAVLYAGASGTLRCEVERTELDGHGAEQVVYEMPNCG
jgi:hypothetical protein